MTIEDSLSTSGVPEMYGGVMVDGLTDGTAYRFEVIAVSDAGDSPPSEASAEVVPTASA